MKKELQQTVMIVLWQTQGRLSCFKSARGLGAGFVHMSIGLTLPTQGFGENPQVGRV